MLRNDLSSFQEKGGQHLPECRPDFPITKNIVPDFIRTGGQFDPDYPLPVPKKGKH